MQYSIIKAILSAVWMISPDFARQMLPVAAALVSGAGGELIAEDDENKPRVYFLSPDGPGDMLDEPAEEDPVVAIYTMHGVITKGSQWCGPPGTLELMNIMQKYEQDPNVVAHVLDFDSGGGEATNIETTARFIRDLEKPVLASYNGLCCSAAYYMAAAADHIFAQEETDIAGSIGAMVTFQDLRGYFEDMGIKLHEIYADQSELKNHDIREAFAGNYEPIKEGLLNPYAQRFIDTVKEFRPGIPDEDVFKGGTYMAAEAVDLKLIDGVKTLAEVIDMAGSLGMARRNHSPLNTQIDMSKTQFAALLAVLGYLAIEFDDEGFVSLNRDELEALNDALEGVQAAQPESIEVGPTVLEQLQAMSDQIQDISTRLESQQEEIQRLWDAPAEGVTAIEKDEDTAAPTDDERKLKEYNDKVAAHAETGRRANFS